MKVLLVVATPPEAKWLLSQAGWSTIGGRPVWKTKDQERELLVTGIGMVNTALRLGEYFANHQPDLAVNLGIAGSFSVEIPMESVVEVGEEIYTELGAGSPEGMLSLKEMGFSHFETQQQTFHNRLKNPSQKISTFPRVTGATVNHVHGTLPEIEKVREIWNPEVESMEGAAFFQACLLHNVSFREFRGISNRVEPRNRANWKIREAAENVQKAVWEWLNQLPA